jgi:hypothetical protein
MRSEMRSIALPSSIVACLSGTLLLLAPRAPAVAGVLDQALVVYELREGSMITDGCLDCERPEIQQPLIGTFALTRVESPRDFDTYAVTDLTLRCPLGAPGDCIAIAGSGTYRIHTRDGNQDMTLDLDVSGASGVKLSSGVVAAPVSWPALDITVTEDGSRDPLHVFTIRIVAVPRPKETVSYELVEGSTLTIDCFVCELANPTQPIEGSFTLGRISEDADPIATYRLDGLSFRNGDGSLQGSGAGIYWQGGEVALFQFMEVEARLEGDFPVLLSSGEVPVTAAFPAIDVTVQRSRPPAEGGPIFLQSLHIVARPVEEPPVPFRRGDANADGATNISDPVYILLWRFSGGETPSCLDAADVNDDDKHDITDPIFLLLFLFQSGSTPPPPGPEACGSAPTPSAGCAAYPAC